MWKSNEERRIRLISQGFNTWKVQVLFSENDLSASEVSLRLAEVKTELAQQFGVPNALLEYNKLLSRTPTRNGLLVQMQISKQNLPAGAPVLRSQPIMLDDGTTMSDMRIEADLMPYDEFDRPMSRAVVTAHLRHQEFDLGCVDWNAVDEAVETLPKTLSPVRGLEIGRGVPAGTGRASRLTWGIRPEQEQFLSSAWLGLRPVFAGDFVVEVSLASGGHKWGRNVYGRELEPRQGIQTRLEAGDGARLALRDSQLTIIRDGLLILKRAGLDRRNRDSWNSVPARLHARVVTPAIITGFDQPFLELREPAMIICDIPEGTHVRSTAPLYIEGNVLSGAQIECSDSIRILGSVARASIISEWHLVITGTVSESTLSAELSLYLDGHADETFLHATDVVARDIHGGTVEALHNTTIDHVDDTGGAATAIRVNLRKYLERQQVLGHEALKDLSDSLALIRSIFGPEITEQVSDGTAQRQMLKWLRDQKRNGIDNYTHSEVRELRAILDMIPEIRNQLRAIGLELRDVTTQLASDQVESPPPATPE